MGPPPRVTTRKTTAPSRQGSVAAADEPTNSTKLSNRAPKSKKRAAGDAVDRKASTQSDAAPKPKINGPKKPPGNLSKKTTAPPKNQAKRKADEESPEADELSIGANTTEEEDNNGNPTVAKLRKRFKRLSDRVDRHERWCASIRTNKKIRQISRQTHEHVEEYVQGLMEAHTERLQQQVDDALEGLKPADKRRGKGDIHPEIYPLSVLGSNEGPDERLNQADFVKASAVQEDLESPGLSDEDDTVSLVDDASREEEGAPGVKDRLLPIQEENIGEAESNDPGKAELPGRDVESSSLSDEASDLG